MTIIKDREGSLITNKKTAANKFKDMSEKIMNQRVDMKPIIEEVVLAMDMLKNIKALAEDTIIAKLLKNGEKDLIAQSKLLVDTIWK